MTSKCRSNCNKAVAAVRWTIVGLVVFGGLVGGWSYLLSCILGG